jgi:hypothetical protein
MTRIFKQALLALGLIMSGQQGFSQWVDYALWTPPSPTPCNIFGQQIAVDGTNHKTTKGQPKFQNSAIYLPCSFSGGQYYGSQYRVQATFKKHYNYEIKSSMEANKGNGGTGAPFVRVRLTNDQSSSSTACNGPEVIDGLSQVSGVSNIATVGVSTYTFTYNNVNDNYAFCEIAGLTTSTNGENGIYVENLLITEKGKTEFSFPAPNMNCTTREATFAVGNPGNVGTVTQYVWKLGTSNNWKYQGSAAPATITTSTNSILLTGNCGAPTSVSVDVYVNNAVWNTYTTNAIACTEQTPNLLITGTSVLCSGTTDYTLSGAPVGSTITWSVDYPYAATLSNVNSPTVTLEKASGINQKVALTATVNCGGTYTKTMEIDLGTPNFGYVSFINPFNVEGSWCSSDYGNQFFIEPPASGTSYELRLLTWPNLSLVYTDPTTHGTNSGTFSYTNNNPGWYVLEVKGTNACGSGDWVGYEVEYVDCSMAAATYFTVEASPNPAQTEMTVRTTNEKPEVKALGKSETVRLILTDFYTMQPVKQWKFDNSQSQFSLNVGELKRGKYVLQVMKGKYRQSRHIILQ